MKTLKIYFVLFLFTISSLAFAQTKSFDEEIAPWHKKATMQCGLLKAIPVNAEQILQNLIELESELKVFTDKYLDNPPQEYANDVNWKSYFQTLSENIVVVRERVEKKQFAQASIYCSIFCKTFGQMHKINGTTDITDMIFSWRIELKNTADMFNAGNTAGAEKNIGVVEDIYNKILEMKEKRNNSSFNELFKPLDEAFIGWLKSIKESNKEEMNISFKKFMNDFAKPYMSSF